jgi:putative oxidoreductase
MKWLILVARVLLGLMMVVFGLNKFLSFAPLPEYPKAAVDFVMVLGGSGYVMKLVGATEVVAGLLILSGRWLPLGVTLLAPVAVNIFFFHLVLAPGGLPVALFVVGCEALLAWTSRHAFAGLFQPLVRPLASGQGRAVLS